MEEDSQYVIVHVAQQQQLSRSDIATAKRAIQDLRSQSEKLQQAVIQVVASQPQCTPEAFQEAWQKREELNKLNERLQHIEVQMNLNAPVASTARLTEKEKQEINGLYQSGLYTQAQLANQYGITQPTVSDIVCKK